MSGARALLCALLLGGCSSDDEPRGFAELGITVENAIGARSQIACETLPFLNGSRRLTSYVIDEAFTITLFSSPGEASLTFTEGERELGQDLVIPRSALEGDYAEELTLVVGGQSYLVSISSGCEP